MDDKENREVISEDRKFVVMTRVENPFGGKWYNIYKKTKQPLHTDILERVTAFKMLEKAETFYKKQELGMVV